jgi:hypothetical protein
MRRIILFLITLALAPIMTQAQNTNTHSRILSHDVPLYECDIAGQGADLTTPINGLKGAIIDSIGNIQDAAGSVVTHYIVKFYPYNAEELQSVFNYKMSVDDIKADKENGRRSVDISVQRYFLISKLDYENGSFPNLKETRFSVTGGVLTVPLKLRFNDWHINDFSKDITLSSVAGVKIKNFKNLGGYTIPFIGVGISSVSLTNENTNGEVTISSERSALSVTAGVIYETKKGLQISLTGGWDHLSKSEPVDWCYNGNFWFGFGVGFSLLSEPKLGSDSEISQDK